MPSIESRLEELVQRAEELRRRGEAVSAEELCRDCPELVMLLQAKLGGESGTKRRSDTSGPNKSPARSDSDSGPARSEGNDDLHIGSEPIQGYRLVLRLGRGGYGEVWKAVAPGGFTVALKFVPLVAEGVQVEQRALDIIRTLRHPCLLTTVGSWQTNRYLVIAMELADRTLKDRFQEAVRQGYIGVPREELLEYFHEAAKGLDFLNEPRHHYDGQERVSFQHRDIKPENILLVGSGAKVADFGLVRLLEQAQTSHTGSMTPIYAAPEFFEGHTSQHSDQYSLAITYCHLRGGRVPFVGSLADVMRGHLKEQPDLSMLPPEERAIVGRALAKVPTQRWPNCATFIAELRNCLIKRGAAPAPAADLGVATYKPPTGSHVTPAYASPSHAHLPAAKSHPTKKRGLGLIVFSLLAVCGVVALAMNDSSKDFIKELFTEKKEEKDKKSEDKKESTADAETPSNKASDTKPTLVTAAEKAPATSQSVTTTPSETAAVPGSAVASTTEKLQVEPPKVTSKPTTKLEAPALLDPNQAPETQPKDDSNKPAVPSVPVAATTPNPTPTPTATSNPSPTPTPQPAPPALPEPAAVSTASVTPSPMPTPNPMPTQAQTPTPTPPTVASTSLREAPLPEPTTVRRPDGKPEPKVIAAAPATVVPRDPPAPLKAPFNETAAKGTQQAWAAYLGRPVVETNSIGLELTLIPTGEFTIGMDTSDVTRPPHAIPPQKMIIKSIFSMGTTEVTQSQWFQLMQTRPWSAHRIKNQDDLPASWISWSDANRFCALLTKLEQEKGLLGKNAQYQLPSESEWEWACRAGTVGKFSCPDGELAQYCWYENNTDEARPVRKLKPNPFGLFDMHGNAAEWCRDNFLNAGSAEPLTKGYLHGGNWKRTARHCASSARDPLAVDSQHSENGFRIMKTH